MTVYTGVFTWTSSVTSRQPGEPHLGLPGFCHLFTPS